MKIFIANPAVSGWRYLLMLTGGLLALFMAPSACAQHACTTNYCIRSQTLSFQTPPGWPAVPIESCCKTDWGALPGGIDWSNGAPVMICTANAEYVTTYPTAATPTICRRSFR